MISVRVEGNAGKELLKLETCSSRGNSATDEENTERGPEGPENNPGRWGQAALCRAPKSLRLPGPPPQDETAMLGMCTGDKS